MADKVQTERLLEPEQDGLPVRKGQPYAKSKLKAVYEYINQTCKAMRNRPWRGLHYIDLFSGPGKNLISDEIVLGSPLLALAIEPPFDRYYFNELDVENHKALAMRIGQHPLSGRCKIFHGDANATVQIICNEIKAIDSYQEGVWSSFNIAFLDPEGLELKWSTIEQLARVSRMDLIILVSTSGLLRVIGKKNFEVVNEFFGTDEWKREYDKSKDATSKRRALIDFYKSRFKKYGYVVDNDKEIITELIVRNQKNVQIYSLIGLSKDKLGLQFWEQTIGRSEDNKRLPGF